MTGKPKDPHASISTDLQELGFTHYEARVYVGLLKASPATAYEISKNNGLTRPNVYSALEGLERKLAVQRVSTEPVRFVPIRPRELLTRISRSVNDRCASLREHLEDLKDTDDVQYVWNLSGAKNAHDKITELIAGARRHVWIKAHCLVLESHVEALRAAAKRGVSILLILFGQKDEIDGYRAIKNVVVRAHEGDGTVVGLGRYLVTLTVDFKEALIVNLKEESGAFTGSGPVVNLAETMIRHEVYLAEIFGAFGKDLEQRFGRALLQLRRQYLPSDQARALARRLSTPISTSALPRGSRLSRRNSGDASK